MGVATNFENLPRCELCYNGVVPLLDFGAAVVENAPRQPFRAGAYLTNHDVCPVYSLLGI